MLSPNSLLQNRYLIIRSIGQGGMGAVYLAKDQRLGNTLALKETFFTDARMRKAFEREARLLAHLRHPALPKVIDHFEESEGQFLVMEFIPGDDLEVLLAQRGKPFDVERVLQWAQQLLDALEYLHTQETPILHRDIKPANLKLTSRDQIILLDFGLAKGEAGQMTSVATSRSVLGFTPNFAPLEQIQGSGTDPRSDLYSLGATLYYLMTGVIPVNALNRATASVSELPDPLVSAHEIDSRIAPAISDLLHRAVALNPNRRPGSAAEMRKELSEANQSLIAVDSTEAKTITLAPTVGTVPPEPRTEAQKTIAAPVPTVPSPRAAVSEPAGVATEAPGNVWQPPAPFAEQTRKPSRLPWIIGGIIALLLVGVAVTVFVINHNSHVANQWQDTESNRAADIAAGVAGRVNGKPIMLSEVDKTLKQQTQGQQLELSPLQLKQARLQALDKLIQREALFQRAEKENLLPNEEQITSAIDQQKQQSRLTQEEFDRQLKEQNMTSEALRGEAKKDLAITSLQDKHAGKTNVSDREVEDYYNANKQQFVNGRGVGLAMIVADPADNSAAGFKDDAKNDSEAKTKIDSVYRQLQSGADFGTVARARSEDANSLTKGGDIGFATEDDLKQNGFPRNLIDQFFGSMQIGAFTAPVRFNTGRWYIFKLTDRRLQTENLTMSSPGVRQQIAETLVKQRTELSNAELLTTSMNEARIVNYLAASKTAN